MWKFPSSSEDILKAMDILAKSYVPKWRLDMESPDIGSVIARIFAGQMETISREYSRIPEQGLEELVRMLGIHPNQPSPARTILIMDVDSACKEGLRIAKGSRFYANAAESEAPLTFRTKHDLLAVHAELSCILGISERERKIVSFLEQEKSTSIPLFDFSGENRYQEVLVLQDSLLGQGQLILKRPFEQKKLFLEEVRIKAWGKNIAPTLLYDGEQELSLDGAAIFGNEIFPYKECYIGQEEVLSKAGARIACTFELEWGCFDPNWRQEKKEELKLIMKRAGKTEKEAAPHVFPQEISLTYFNGTGFKKLHCEEGPRMLTQVFAGKKRCRIQFYCPQDIKPMTVGGDDLRCVRLQIQRAGNCYFPGAVFHYPILENMKFSYTYGKEGVRPKAVRVHQGSRCTELTDRVIANGNCELFSDFPYRGENVLFGFDRVWGAGPVSFYLNLENEGPKEKADIVYEYSTADGFKPLHVTDGTQGLLRSGLVRFVLPCDAEKFRIEDRSCFWIRLRDMGGASYGGISSKRRNPLLKGLKLNGVEAENLFVSEEREFHLEKAKPDLTEKLFGNHILDAEVWVNEISSLPDGEKELLLRESPQDVQIEYDIRGQAVEFFVKWKESQDLGVQAGDGRYYVLDRKAGLLKFGDGRHTKMPEEINGTAWKVKVTSCGGRRGNVEKDTITDPALSYVFLNKAYNPLGAYGGSDGEDEGELVRRGRDFLSTGQKIVSEADFLREAQGFSKQISQAVLLKGTDAGYRLIVLLKDSQKEGFIQLREALRLHLEERFPLAFPGQCVQIQEPVFAEISVNVWIAVNAWEAYEAEEAVLQKLGGYLSGRALRIGDVPGRQELEQVIYQALGKARIRYFQAILTYTDDTGKQETALEEIRTMRDMVCINGKHCVHTELAARVR